MTTQPAAPGSSDSVDCTSEPLSAAHTEWCCAEKGIGCETSAPAPAPPQVPAPAPLPIPVLMPMPSPKLQQTPAPAPVGGQEDGLTAVVDGSSLVPAVAVSQVPGHVVRDAVVVHSDKDF